MKQYIYSNQKKLRCGYTTGSCAAAAAAGATLMLLGQEKVEQVIVNTPKGIPLSLALQEQKLCKDEASCAVKKDAGDDSDITDGALVYATVRLCEDGIFIDGGIGIGRVTKKGLDQPIGAAAINSVPRKMIENAVREVMEEAGYHKGVEIIISIPNGEELARKTFNGRLGIIGGLSILGTSGIVEPMSERALIETIRTELSMLHGLGEEYIVVTPGNYGENYISTHLREQISYTVKASNFIGDTIDMAYEYQFKGILLIGHIGKFVKLAAGIMNTHSKYADGRREVIVTCALQAGADRELLLKLCDAITTDEALEMLQKEGMLEKTMECIMENIEDRLEHRAYDGLLIGAITFSNQFGFLGKTSKVDQLIEAIVAQGKARKENE